jgi:hypothetical protein
MPRSSTLHTPALMGNDEPELFTVPNVEVFATGKWNGREITSEDLDHIVDAYASTKETIRPFLKLGHSEEQPLLVKEGLPSAGWIENVRRSGSKIIADFVDIPKSIYSLIKRKAYRKVSSEIYRNVELDGKTYPRLLGAVALLGAELPAVLSLADIMGRYKHAGGENFAFDLPSDILLERTTVSHSEGEPMPETPQSDDVLKFKLDEANAALAAAKAEADKYKADLEAVSQENTANAAKLVAAEKAAKKAEVEKFVSGLKAENLCTKAMEPLVSALVSDEVVEKYSIDGKDMSRQELVKSVIKFAAEAGKVNFKEVTTTTEPEGGKPTETQKIKAQIDKYALDHKVSWDVAYKEVTRSMDLTPKRMTESEQD